MDCANNTSSRPHSIDYVLGYHGDMDPVDEDDDHELFDIPIGDVLDLHSFQPRDVVPAALSYLEAAREAGYRQVRLIHGKGIGVQRANIRLALSKLDWVESATDSDWSAGGWGATIVTIRP